MPDDLKRRPSKKLSLAKKPSLRRKSINYEVNRQSGILYDYGFQVTRRKSFNKPKRRTSKPHAHFKTKRELQSKVLKDILPTHLIQYSLKSILDTYKARPELVGVVKKSSWQEDDIVLSDVDSIFESPLQSDQDELLDCYFDIIKPKKDQTYKHYYLSTESESSDSVALAPSGKLNFFKNRVTEMSEKAHQNERACLFASRSTSFQGQNMALALEVCMRRVIAARISLRLGSENVSSAHLRGNIKSIYGNIPVL